MATTTHRWKFFRAGGLDQAVLRDGADIAALEDLDEKLWVALACPTRGTELDPRTLDLMDTDHDGRIRVPEVRAAVRWVREVLRDPGDLIKGGDSVALSAIDDSREAGAALLAGARRVLSSLGKPDATTISLADVADTARIFSAASFNGDGVVPPDSAPDGALRKAIEDIVATHGGTPDRSGKAGVSRAILDAFFADAQALSDWHAIGEGDGAVRPLGEGTAAAAAAVAAVKAKVDDHFTRSRLAALDPRAAVLLGGSEEDWRALGARELSASAPEVARLPLTSARPGQGLPLTEGVNPAWAGPLAELARAALQPLLGISRGSMSEEDWRALQGKLAAYDAWMAARPATRLDALGVARAREILALRPAIDALVQQDEAVAGEFAQIESVERLVRYHRDLFKFLNNFVNLSEFYTGRGGAFQAGTLFIDERSCELCLRVEDGSKHAQLAGLSKVYLAYCDCSRASGEKMTIVAAFTDGDSDYLMVGRNGVFYDRKGQDWDATITRIVDNPISVRQAFWAPYKSFIRLIEEQIAKRAAAAEEEVARGLRAAAETATSDKTAPAGGKVPAKKIDVGTVAALGVAVGGIATFLSSILATFLGLGLWMPLGLVALVLAISGPSMFIAWLKLRQRSLGPILDANGWAINGRVKITVPFGAALTSVAALPPGAERSLRDPYAEKKSLLRILILLGVLAAVSVALIWYLGRLDAYLPKAARSVQVLGEQAPAYHAPPPRTPGAGPPDKK